MEINNKTAMKSLKIGANREGYWDSLKMKEQFELAIKIFNLLHPNKQALFAFDNSSNHGIPPDDALLVSKMNLNDGWKTYKGLNCDTPMRDGWFINRNGERVNQCMINRNGVQKGIRHVLIERELWHSDMKLPEASKLLSQQPDFLEEKDRTMLQDMAEKSGHKLIYFPKFHPEFNFIERYWGLAKHFARKNCNYSMTALEKTLPAALSSIEVDTIRKLNNHCWRYMIAYSNGKLEPHQVEWAIKKYSSHRRIKDNNKIDEFDFLTEEFLIGMPCSNNF